MPHPLRRTFRWPTLLLAGSLLTAGGCSREQQSPESQAEALSTHAQAQEGEIIDLSKLPPMEPEEASQVSLQQLEQPSALDENVAVHVKLAPPRQQGVGGQPRAGARRGGQPHPAVQLGRARGDRRPPGQPGPRVLHRLQPV